MSQVERTLPASRPPARAWSGAVPRRSIDRTPAARNVGIAQPCSRVRRVLAAVAGRSASISPVATAALAITALRNRSSRGFRRSVVFVRSHGLACVPAIWRPVGSS